MFVELHMLQSFSPSNLNRDDTNNPKDCEFGGVRRARISSQCLKRAIRTCPVFAQATGVETGIRTRRIIAHLTPGLLDQGKSEEECIQVLGYFVPAYLSKLDGGDLKKAQASTLEGQAVRTSVLIYLSSEEREALIQAVLENWEPLLAQDKAVTAKLTKGLTKRFKAHSAAPDIALFGRMLAENPELNLEAACQVAHALSTHRVAMEMDWWTAVDDLQPDDNAGAGMMGFGAHNSACYYRYARIDVSHLADTLGDANLARRTVEGFCHAAVAAVPSGKQNSHAALNPPSLLLGVVREDGMAWSLANAFERPVTADRQGGYIAPSAAALDAYWGRLCGVFGTGSLRAVAALPLDGDLPLEHLDSHRQDSLESWLAALLGALPGEEGAA